jgi:hypothetical protein
MSVQLQEMESESQIAPAAFRISMNRKVQKYRGDLDRIKRDLRQASSAASSRSELLSGNRTYGTQDPAVSTGKLQYAYACQILIVAVNLFNTLQYIILEMLDT